MKIKHFGIIILLYCFLCSCSNDKWRIDQPENFWELIEGDWRIDPEYKVNSETFATEASDQFTILSFSTLSQAESGQTVTGNSIFLENFIKVNNTGYDEQFLNFGTILGKRQPLPANLDLLLDIGECFNCRYSDLQLVDIVQGQTDTIPFQIINLENDHLEVQFITNIYNRQFNGETILDTLIFSFGREVDNFTVGAGFNIESLPREAWYKSIFDDDCGELGNVQSCFSSIDGLAMCFNDMSSALCIDNDLFRSIENDNEVTISFWINPVSINRAKQILYSKYRNSAGPFIFSLIGNRVAVEINGIDGDLEETLTLATVDANEWTHLAFAYRNEELLICINGEVDRRVDTRAWFYDAEAAIYFGNSEYALDNNLNQGFEGMMDEIIFFERYLNQGVIRQLYLWHLNN